VKELCDNLVNSIQTLHEATIALSDATSKQKFKLAQVKRFNACLKEQLAILKPDDAAEEIQSDDDATNQSDDAAANQANVSLSLLNIFYSSVWELI